MTWRIEITPAEMVRLEAPDLEVLRVVLFALSRVQQVATWDDEDGRTVLVGDGSLSLRESGVLT